MSFLKKNFWTLSCLVLLIAMGMCGDAWADGNSLMKTAQRKARNVFTEVKIITFILGGFGLTGVAFAAIMGKVNWKWFAGLAVGLGILGAAGRVQRRLILIRLSAISEQVYLLLCSPENLAKLRGEKARVPKPRAF